MSRLPGLAAVGAVCAFAYAVGSRVDVLSPLVIAVAFGVTAANLVGIPKVLEPGLELASRALLRLGVVLLGVRLSLAQVTDLGAPALALVVVTVGVTFTATHRVGRRLGMSDGQSLLVATGFSICGASAIAAVKGSTGARREEVVTAIGLVTLCGTLAIIVLPALARPLGLADAEFGAWVGASVHDVAQVVATASTGGETALSTAVVVKLTRVALLAPIVVAVNLRSRRLTRATTSGQRLLPLFVVGFLAAVVVRSTGLLPLRAVEAARVLDGVLLTAALVGLGAGVNVRQLRTHIRGAALLLGAIAWLTIAAISFVGVALTTWAP